MSATFLAKCSGNAVLGLDLDASSVVRIPWRLSIHVPRRLTPRISIRGWGPPIFSAMGGDVITDVERDFSPLWTEVGGRVAPSPAVHVARWEML